VHTVNTCDKRSYREARRIDVRTLQPPPTAGQIPLTRVNGI